VYPQGFWPHHLSLFPPRFPQTGARPVWFFSPKIYKSGRSPWKSQTPLGRPHPLHPKLPPGFFPKRSTKTFFKTEGFKRGSQKKSWGPIERGPEPPHFLRSLLLENAPKGENCTTPGSKGALTPGKQPGQKKGEKIGIDTKFGSPAGVSPRFPKQGKRVRPSGVKFWPKTGPNKGSTRTGEIPKVWPAQRGQTSFTVGVPRVLTNPGGNPNCVTVAHPLF